MVEANEVSQSVESRLKSTTESLQKELEQIYKEVAPRR